MHKTYFDFTDVYLKEKHWATISKYLHPKLQIQPQLVQSERFTFSPRQESKATSSDMPEFQTRWVLGMRHIKDMRAIPLRILVQNGIHTTLSQKAVSDAITGYSDKTLRKLIEQKKLGAITSALRFEADPIWTPGGYKNFYDKGVLIIPYFSPAKGGRYKDFIEAQKSQGIANFTVRTNAKGMKYARMATNAYNEVEEKKVLPRMPYLPFGTLTEETKYTARSMMLDDTARVIVGESASIKDYSECRDSLALSLDNITARNGGKKPPIYIIEGEKKALALYSAVEAQYQAELIAEYTHSSEKFTAQPIEVVGVSGVWQTKSGSIELQPDLLACVDFKDRDVVIIYDNDMKSNHQIVNAIAAFGAGLTQAGAKSVSMAYPSVPEICKGHETECKGFDDIIATAYDKTLEAEGLSVLYSTGDRAIKANSALIKTSVMALDNVNRNIVPIKTCHMTAKEIKQQFYPFNVGKGTGLNPLDIVADSPTRTAERVPEVEM